MPWDHRPLDLSDPDRACLYHRRIKRQGSVRWNDRIIENGINLIRGQNDFCKPSQKKSSSLVQPIDKKGGFASNHPNLKVGGMTGLDCDLKV